MHRAPSVTYSVNRSRWQFGFIVGVSLLALATLAVFSLEQAASELPAAAIGFALLIASAGAFLGWKKSLQGSLRWDGQHWYWSGFAGSPQCFLTLLMDFQSVVIVAIKPDAAAAKFLWLEKSPRGTNWRPLRRAIVSSQTPLIGSDKQVESNPQRESA